MLSLLPIGVFLLLVFWQYSIARSWRQAWLVAMVIWGCVLVAITETLSFLQQLNWPMVAGMWGVLFVALFIMQWPRQRLIRSDIKQVARKLVTPAMLFPLVWLAWLGLTALWAAPNNFDAMTYHLPRVMHWIQQGNVNPYPTAIQRQLYLSPGAEYIILHFQLLLGHDYLANSVQWFSLLSSALGISLIVKQLGGNERAQWLGGVAVLTLPMAVLQATSTQNDLVVTSWLVCVVWAMFQAMRPKSKTSLPQHWISCATMGAALGLAVLTKGTAYLFGLAFCLWLSFVLLKQLKAKALGPLFVLAAMMIAINLPQYSRQWKLYHSPLGLNYEPAYLSQPVMFSLNDHFDLATTASNLLRSSAMHLSPPWQSINKPMEKAVVAIHRAFGSDPSDPSRTWFGTRFVLTGSRWFDENCAPNPLHMLLVLLSVIGLIFLRKTTARQVWFYLFAMLFGMIFFCTILRWSVWHTRLHLPWTILMMPLLALVWTARWPFGKAFFKGPLCRRRVTILLAIILFASGMPSHLYNIAHPWLGEKAFYRLPREQQYFLTGQSRLLLYQQAADFAIKQKAQRVGLVLGSNDWEYPLWVLIKKKLPHAQIEHVDVQNQTAKLRASQPLFSPDVVLVIRAAEKQYHLLEKKKSQWIDHAPRSSQTR